MGRASASLAGRGFNSSHDRPKSLKLVVVAFLLGAQDHGDSTLTDPPVLR